MWQLYGAAVGRGIVTLRLSIVLQVLLGPLHGLGLERDVCILRDSVLTWIRITRRLIRSCRTYSDASLVPNTIFLTVISGVGHESPYVVRSLKAGPNSLQAIVVWPHESPKVGFVSHIVGIPKRTDGF